MINYPVTVVLAGTSEGRKLIRALQDRGYPVIGSVSTQYGARLLLRDGISHFVQGSLDHDGLKRLIEENKAQLMIDATHPFALTISRQAMEVCKENDILYLRLEREGGKLPVNPWIKTIRRLEEGEQFIKPKMRVFSTLGTKSLPVLAEMVNRQQGELIARVLPASDVIKRCEQLGLLPDQIVAIKGPFTADLNRAIFKMYKADLIITKESGDAGGVNAKIQAAIELGIPIVVWLKPQVEYPVMFNSVPEIIKYMENIQGGYHY
ncbi:MAG: precorrin-6A reductase [Syntrophomonadaceae bacterium]|nr:precorrin-6A reductase [Syntrophomonadaceae bacterium]